MDKILVDENRDYGLDYTNTVWASDQMHQDFHDAKVPLSDADFLIENNTTIMIVEYKLVPVIVLTTNTRGVAYDYVDVILTSVSRKVTNLITYFDFIQTEKVTDTMKARSIIAY